MRRARIAAGACATALVAGLVLLPAAGAVAETTRLPGSLTTVAQRTGPLQVTVPLGVVPSALSAVISADRLVEGSSIVVLVNGREAARVPSTLYTRVIVPISSTDVVADGTLALSLRYDAPLGATGCEPPPAIALRRIELEYTGVETPPTTVAGFFPDGASRVDVRLPPDPDDDLLAAALGAVAAVSSRYGADTPVELSTTDTPLPTIGAGQRVVLLSGPATPAGPEGEGEVASEGDGEAEGEVTTSLANDSGVPALVLTGAGAPLAEAAAALGSDSLGLAGTPQTGALRAQPVSRPEDLTRTLADLRAGAAAPLASGIGTFEAPLRQDGFGGPVSELRLHLEGVHSAVPTGVSARLDVYVDETLVDSTSLGADPRIELDIEVASDLIRSAGTLRAVISAATTVGAGAPVDPAAPVAPAVPVQCSPGLPLELALDLDASTVTATRGTGDLRGFQLFPQALAGRLPVALRGEGATRVDDAIDAARVISAVQRQADAPLEVTLVDPEDLIDGDRSGLLVGAGTDDSQRLGAPLSLAGTRTLDTQQDDFAVESAAPFAALQAISEGGRHVLLLGSWAPGDTTAAPSLSHRITQALVDGGWGDFEGDVLLLDEGSVPLSLDTGTPVDATEPTEEATSYLTWFALPVVVLVGLLALWLGRMLRRRSEAIAAATDPYAHVPATRRTARSRPSLQADDPLLGPFTRSPRAGSTRTGSTAMVPGKDQGNDQGGDLPDDRRGATPSG